MRIELYRLAMGAKVWTITSADVEQVYAGEIYYPVAIGRGGIESKNELSKANIEVRLDLSHEISQLLLTGFNTQLLSLNLFTSEDGVVNLTWKGRLSSQKPTDTHIVAVFESVFTSLKRPGVRARFQKSCRHALYKGGCRLDAESFGVAATVTASSGNVLTIPVAASSANGTFIGGMLRTADSLLCYIVGHTGNQVTVQNINASLKNAISSGYGFAVTIYPGCDHSRATCASKFNNLDNYGGFDWIPEKNPMGGSSII